MVAIGAHSEPLDAYQHRPGRTPQDGGHGAATNPGDSGGALFNTAGQVIGVNSAIATGGSRTTGSIGVGFAIPSNDVTAFLAQHLTRS